MYRLVIEQDPNNPRKWVTRPVVLPGDPMPKDIDEVRSILQNANMNLPKNLSGLIIGKEDKKRASDK